MCVTNLYLHLPKECTYVKIIYSLIGNIYGNITFDIGQYMLYILHFSMEYHFQKNYATAGITLIQLTVTVSLLIIMKVLHIKALKNLFHNLF